MLLEVFFLKKFQSNFLFLEFMRPDEKLDIPHRLVASLPS